MADADILPYDYRPYAKEIAGYIATAQQKSETAKLSLDFAAARKAASRLESASESIYSRQIAPAADPAAIATMNHALRDAESALLDPAGLPRRGGGTNTPSTLPVSSPGTRPSSFRRYRSNRAAGRRPRPGTTRPPYRRSHTRRFKA